MVKAAKKSQLAPSDPQDPSGHPLGQNLNLKVTVLLPSELLVFGNDLPADFKRAHSFTFNLLFKSIRTDLPSWDVICLAFIFFSSHIVIPFIVFIPLICTYLHHLTSSF